MSRYSKWFDEDNFNKRLPKYVFTLTKNILKNINKVKSTDGWDGKNPLVLNIETHDKDFSYFYDGVRIINKILDAHGYKALQKAYSSTDIGLNKKRFKYTWKISLKKS